MQLRLNNPVEAKVTLNKCRDLESKDGQHYTMLGRVLTYLLTYLLTYSTSILYKYG
jgi:hypothetical protein